ncbi:aminopeptidase P family protein, partial [Candidatus Woesearchaeota archaeon]|nr:aminopeptidase P family protein [Candidatus Woesearchaeota archaeon]
MKLIEFRSILRKKKIDLVWFSSPDPNITYFTQQAFDPAILLVTQRSAVVYVSALDKAKPIKGVTIRHFKLGWQKKISHNRAISLGVNKDKLTVATYEGLKKLFPKARFVDISKDVTVLRTTKTSAEINKIAKACTITDNAFSSFVKKFNRRKFKTEQDVALFLEDSIKSQGGGVGFPTIVAMGKNAAVPHHKVSLTPLKRGFLLMDFGASYKNYNADMTRIVFLGKPTKAEREMYGLLLKAQESAIETVREGVTYGELDSVSRKILGKYDKRFTHALGHGIGIDVHESPRVGGGSKEKIERGHV